MTLHDLVDLDHFHGMHEAAARILRDLRDLATQMNTVLFLDEAYLASLCGVLNRMWLEIGDERLLRVLAPVVRGLTTLRQRVQVGGAPAGLPPPIACVLGAVGPWGTRASFQASAMRERLMEELVAVCEVATSAQLSALVREVLERLALGLEWSVGPVARVA